MERKDLASWMDGTPVDQGYIPGSGLGLPSEGPGSVAPFGRRVLALLIDWAAASAVSLLLLDYSSLGTLSLFAAMNLVMLTLWGATLGQLILRLRTRPVTGRRPMLVRSILRTAVLLMVIPAAIWDRDRRPFHDVASGLAVVRA